MSLSGLYLQSGGTKEVPLKTNGACWPLEYWGRTIA